MKRKPKKGGSIETTSGGGAAPATREMRQGSFARDLDGKSLIVTGFWAHLLAYHTFHSHLNTYLCHPRQRRPKKWASSAREVASNEL